MKKIIFALSIVALFGCEKKRDWTCSCEYNGINGKGTKTDVVHNVTQTDAQNACNNWCESENSGNGTYKTTLKAN